MMRGNLKRGNLRKKKKKRKSKKKMMVWSEPEVVVAATEKGADWKAERLAPSAARKRVD